MITKWIKIFVLTSLVSVPAFSLPSPFGRLSPEIKIPKVNGKRLPVSLIPDHENSHLIHVIPLSGMVRGSKLEVSPETNCALLDQVNSKSVDIVQLMHKKIQNIHDNIIEFDTYFYNKYLEASGKNASASVLLDFYKENKWNFEIEKELNEAEIAHFQYVIKNTEEDCVLLNIPSDICAEEKMWYIEEIQHYKLQLKDCEARILQNEIALKETQVIFDETNKIISEIEKRNEDYSKSQKKLQEDIDKLNNKNESEMESFSKTKGGILKSTYDFTPLEYLEVLKDRNPDFYFEYVKTNFESIDYSFPFSEPSDMNKVSGNLILNRSMTQKDSFHELTLELSVIGVCSMLKSNEELNQDFVDVFSLYKVFNYSTYSEIKVSGSYNKSNILYQLFLQILDPSWNQKSKEDKVNFMKSLIVKAIPKFKIIPNTDYFSFQESVSTAEKFKENLIFIALRDFLVLTSSHEEQIDQFLNKKMSLLEFKSSPSLFEAWQGEVSLQKLSDMFQGKSSQEIQETINNTENTLFIKNFEILESNSSQLVVGDLDENDFKH